MSEFTEGPWQSQHDFDMYGVCRIIGAIDGPDDGRFHYKVVCEIDPDGSMDARTQCANARLIAAAPELYEALDFAMNAMMGMREAFVELDIRIPPTLDAEIKRARETLSRAVPVSTGSPQDVDAGEARHD